jgi:hypothetical protein
LIAWIFIPLANNALVFRSILRQRGMFADPPEFQGDDQFSPSMTIFFAARRQFASLP